MQQKTAARPAPARTTASRKYAPTDFSTEKLYTRLSALTRIRKERLKPRVVGADKRLKRVKAEALYNATGHVVFLKKGEQKERNIEHELRHGMQEIAHPKSAEKIKPRRLLEKGIAREALRRIMMMLMQEGEIYSETPILNGVKGWERNIYMLAVSTWNAIKKTVFGLCFRLWHWGTTYGEYSVPVISTTFKVFELVCYATAAAWIAVTVANAFGARKLRQATEKYGPDGYLALNLLECPHPINAMRILKRLEAERILTTEGFTARGIEWALAFRGQIIAFLEKAESQREKEIKEALK